VGAVQADRARKELIEATKKEFVKYLPQLAQEQYELIHQTVNKCFEDYDIEVIKRLNDDIKSRKAELDNLLAQKESREINGETELKRLKNIDAEVHSELQMIESVYQSLLSIPA
jgi:hypothetical protein